MAPKIDKRQYGDHLAILEHMRIRLDGAERTGMRNHFVPDWTTEFEPGKNPDPGLVMNRLFARLMSVLGERLNKIPEKHFAAFLDLVGVERLPGSPARAPITFAPTPTTSPGQQVPQGTQLATTQTETEPAVIFETEMAFELTPVSLKKLATIDPRQDKWRDITEQVTAMERESSAVVFEALPGDLPVEHSLYLVHDGFFNQKDPQKITLQIDIQTAGTLAANVIWESYDGKTWVPVPHVANAAGWLTAGGSIDTVIDYFQGGEPVLLHGEGEARRWLRCRVTTPVTASDAVYPLINRILLESGPPGEPRTAPGFFPELAFYNTFPIDLNNDFYPFGERPKQSDAFYFSSSVFHNPEPGSGREITLTMALASIPGQTVNTFPRGSDSAKLFWEYYSDSDRWETLTVTRSVSKAEHFRHSPSSVSTFTLKFPIEDNMAIARVNGKEGYWIRARISEGDYGKDATVDITVSTTAPFVTSYDYQAATFRPPFLSVTHLKIDYTSLGSRVPVTGCKSINHFYVRDHLTELLNSAQFFNPYLSLRQLEDEQPDKFAGLSDPSLYFGFDDSFKNIRISQLLVMQRMNESEVAALRDEVDDSPEFVWEYRNLAGRWARLNTQDNTRAVSVSNTVAFTAPADTGASMEFDFPADIANLFWIRVRLAAGRIRATRRLREFHLNSVWARSLRTVESEVLRAGTGERGQTLRVSQSPIMPGEILRVREDNPLSESDLDDLQRLERRQADELEIDEQKPIRPATDELTPGTDGYWVRWYPVANARFSTPKDRHYVIDRVTGEITFAGMPVPRGRERIWLQSYQVNQGGSARRAAKVDTIQQLKTSLPYVAAVTNRLPAEGGAEAEHELQTVLKRGSGTLKHRNRAVTREDFEALAREADPGLHLVRTLPVSDARAKRKLGAVTIIIVPFSLERQPQPSADLLNQVHRYLVRRGSETAIHRFNVIGPSYIDVSVTAQIIPRDITMASVVVARVANSLNDYFHPLIGGPENRGWPFAANLHISDVYRHLESIDGVDTVRHAAFAGSDADTVVIEKNKLPSSGEHNVSIIA